MTTSRSGATAAVIEPTAMRAPPARTHTRRPSRLINMPNTGIATADVSAHAVKTQEVSPKGTCRPDASSGSATVGAPNAMNCGVNSAPKTTPSRTGERLSLIRAAPRGKVRRSLVGRHRVEATAPLGLARLVEAMQV